MRTNTAFPQDRDGVYLPPVGILEPHFDELQAAGCIQCESEGLRQMFNGLWAVTGRNPCNGCPIWETRGPTCEAFRRHHSAWKEAQLRSASDLRDATQPEDKNSSNPELFGLSVRAIAQKLGVSISEVRRRKAAGTL